jgi:hypothetical protein
MLFSKKVAKNIVSFIKNGVFIHSWEFTDRLNAHLI